MPPFLMEKKTLCKEADIRKQVPCLRMRLLRKSITKKKAQILVNKICAFSFLIGFLRDKTKTANHLVCGLDVSDMIRTRDLLIRSQTLYPAELHAHIKFILCVAPNE